MSAAIDESQSVVVGALVHGRYRITRTIGRGGMGAVFEAVDERLNTRVAIKESFANESELKRQFHREARLLAGLKHRSLPRVTDYFVDGERAVLVMEFVDGVSLAEVVGKENSPVPVRDVIAWADQVLDVLIYLHGHDRKVVHRDIKPHNLKLTPEGVVCLLDFGLVKATLAEDESADGDGRSVHGFTRRYSPIEQIQDSGTSERSDIYALGATLYHLLTGLKPEDAEKRAAAIAAGNGDCLLRADLVLPVVGEELGLMLERAMALDSGDRFATAAEFREALKKLGRVRDGQLGASDDSPLVVTGRTSGKLYAVAAFVIVALIGVGVFFIKVPPAVSDAGTWANAPIALVRGESAGSAGLRISTPPAKERARSNRSSSEKERVKAKVVAEREVVKAVARREVVKPTRRASTPPKEAKVTERREKAPRREPSETLRAPDGTEIVKYRDGRIKVFGERGRQ